MFNGANITYGIKIAGKHCYFFLFNHSVAKKKSLFDDRPMEIQELTYIIKQVQTSSCFFNYNDYYSCAVFSCIQSTSTVIFSIDLSTPASTLKLFVYFFG